MVSYPPLYRALKYGSRSYEMRQYGCLRVITQYSCCLVLICNGHIFQFHITDVKLITHGTHCHTGLYPSSHLRCLVTNPCSCASQMTVKPKFRFKTLS